jgi:hypothetical protein
VKITFQWIIVFFVATIVLAAYFLPLPQIQIMRDFLLDWAITLAGVAGLVGIVNLLSIHSLRIRDEKPGWIQSLVVILGFTTAFVIGMLFKPSHPLFQRMVTSIQFPVEASLLALLSITLAVALIRAIRPGMNRASLIFISVVIVFIWAGTGFIPFQGSSLVQSILSILNTLQLGGARGILLGVALGGITTGIRLWIGRDLPAEK